MSLPLSSAFSRGVVLLHHLRGKGRSYRCGPSFAEAVRMNADPVVQLDDLLDAHLPRGELKTPVLNKASLLLALLDSSCEAQQALVRAAPMPDKDVDTDAWRAACEQHWNDLAPGTLLSRQAHARALRHEDLLHRAQLLALFGELSEVGQRLLGEALEPGQGSTAQASSLQWVGSDGQAIVLPGAVLIEQTGQPHCLLIFPGLEQQLFEFQGRDDLCGALGEYLLSEAGTAALVFISAQYPETWHSPDAADMGFRVQARALAVDVLDYCVQGSISADQARQPAPASLRQAWFWRPLPAALVSAVQGAVDADARRQQALLTFGAVTPDIASGLVKQHLSEREEAIHRAIGDTLGSDAHKRYRQHHAAWQSAQDDARQVTTALWAAPVLAPDYWTGKDANGLSRISQLARRLGAVMAADARLQQHEGRLWEADMALVTEVVNQPEAAQRQRTGTVVAELAIGDSHFSYSLPGAYVIGPEQAWQASPEPSTEVPVLLWLAGSDGGLRRFGSLGALLACVVASLKDPAFTPLWARFGVAAQAQLSRLLALAKVPLVTQPVSGHWLEQYVSASIERHPAGANAALTAQARAELAQALAPPVDELRELAVDRLAEQRRLQATLDVLPPWVAEAPLAWRNEYAQALDHYNQVAGAQERYLANEPMYIEQLAAVLIAARIKADLGHRVDPEKIALKLPEHVEIKAIANVPSEILRPSETTETISLVELALLNIDRQVTLRLKFATLLDSESGSELGLAGLTVAYLRTLVIDLDVARQYDEKITALFDISATATQAQALRAQIMAQPYRASLALEALSAWRRGHIDEAGHRLFSQLLAVRSAAQWQAEHAGVTLSTAHLWLGGTGPASPSGLLLIEDTANERCFLYLPKVPEGAAFIQRSTVEALKGDLLRRLRSPSMRTWLAGLAGIGQASRAAEDYLWQAYEREFSGFVRFTALGAPTWPLAAALLHNRSQTLRSDGQRKARSRADVREAFARQLREGGKDLLRSGLSYLPVIGTGIQLYDGWNDATDAVQAFRQGDTALGLRRLVSAELNFGFALLSIIPGMALAKSARSSLRLRQARRLEPAPVHMRKPGYARDDFTGFEVDVDLVGASPQTGVDAGTWKQGGKLYLWQDNKAYEVFRRSHEFTLRLRRAGNQLIDPPVRRAANGRFVRHGDTGLRAGGRSRAGSTEAASPSTLAKYEIDAGDVALMDEFLRSAGKYDLWDGAVSIGAKPKATDAPRSVFIKKRAELLKDADAYLENVTLPARPSLPVLDADLSHAALIEAVYAKSNGLVIGEAHGASAPKRFLQDNFATLKAQGVNTLYFEHLMSDFHFDDLVTLNTTGELTASLAKRLDWLDSGNRLTGDYTFRSLIVAANKQGLEVVSLDCAAAYYDKGVLSRHAAPRGQMFSYTATQVIGAHQLARGEHKWVALVGNSHSNTFKGVPGLAELNRAIGLRVDRTPTGQRPRLTVDAGEALFGSGGQLVKADLHLQVDVPGMPPEPVATTTLARPGPSRLTSTAPRLRRPGMFYIEKVADKRVIVHMSRDGQIYRTPVMKELGHYWVARPTWDKVHGRKFWTLDGLLKALAEQNLTRVD